MAKARGYNYTAIEPAHVRQKLLEEAGLPVFKGDFDQFVETWEEGGQEAFDIIVLDNVLEHIVKPKLCVSEIKRLMKRGSYIVSVTPNLMDIRGVFNKGWYARQFEPVGHVNYFTYKTIKRLLNSEGICLVSPARIPKTLGLAWLFKSASERFLRYHPLGLYVVGRLDTEVNWN